MVGWRKRKQQATENGENGSVEGHSDEPTRRKLRDKLNDKNRCTETASDLLQTAL